MKGRVFLDGPGVQVSTIVLLGTRMLELFYTFADDAIHLDPLHLTEAKTLVFKLGYIHLGFIDELMEFLRESHRYDILALDYHQR